MRARATRHQKATHHRADVLIERPRPQVLFRFTGVSLDPDADGGGGSTVAVSSRKAVGAHETVGQSFYSLVLMGAAGNGSGPFSPTHISICLSEPVWANHRFS